MFCECSKIFIENALSNAGLRPAKITSGVVVLETPATSEQIEAFDNRIKTVGLRVLTSKAALLVDKIKTNAWNYIRCYDEHDNKNFSEYLSEALGYEYNYLSHVFSEHEDMSISHYLNLLRIELAKELIDSEDITFSELAYRLKYANLSHLSYTFKKITGITLSAYRKSQNLERNEIYKL